MRELDSIEISTVKLAPGCAQTLMAAQPHPDIVLLSHLEVPELSPESSAVELTDLRIGKLCYLLAPVGLRFLQRAQRYTRECAEQRQRQQQQRLLGSVPIPLPLIQQFKPSRRETRLLILDILWKPHQQLTVTLRNSDTSAATKVSIELVLYAHDKPLPVAN